MAESKKKSGWSSDGRSRRPKVKKKSEALTPVERRRINQLVACLLIFGVVFLGRSTSLGPLTEFSNHIGTLIHQNMDFKGAFSKIGQSIAQGEPVAETFGILWTEVFGLGEKKGPEGTEPLPETPPEVNPPSEETPADFQEPTPAETPVPEPAPAQAPAATEPPPTAAATVTQTAAKESVTPVLGVLTSGFGPRTHPIDGQWKEHDGVDIDAKEGTPILAYEAGQIEYVGESPSYGLYLQIRHDDGFASFYAHCSSISVKQGQWVAVGQEVAKVGQTGNVTGPHLHFELKKDGQRVDPVAYIETLPA